MKKQFILDAGWTLLLIISVSIIASGQMNPDIFTGTVVDYGSGAYTGIRTAGFTLTINDNTRDDRAGHFLSILQNNGQGSLLNEIRKEDLGTFTLNGGLRRTINVVREKGGGGSRKIYIVFERWEQFAEQRNGYRSLDYPFGYIELDIGSDGRGSGTYFAAAKISWKKEGSANGTHIEIEDYATLPAKLVEVEEKTRP